MMWNVGTMAPSSATSSRADARSASRAVAPAKLSEFSARRRHHRHFSRVRHYRRAFALSRPYHYRAYYRPHYRPYYRPYRAFGFYRPWDRPYYDAYYRPAYSYYRPVRYGWPYYNSTMDHGPTFPSSRSASGFFRGSRQEGAPPAKGRSSDGNSLPRFLFAVDGLARAGEHSNNLGMNA